MFSLMRVFFIHYQLNDLKRKYFCTLRNPYVAILINQIFEDVSHLSEKENILLQKIKSHFIVKII